MSKHFGSSYSYIAYRIHVRIILSLDNSTSNNLFNQNLIACSLCPPIYPSDAELISPSRRQPSPDEFLLTIQPAYGFPSGNLIRHKISDTDSYVVYY